MRIGIFFVFLCTLWLSSNAQHSIEFICTDSLTKEPVSFCNIKLNGQVQITDGMGILKIEFVPDSVEIYALGFQVKKIYKSSLQLKNFVRLSPRITALKGAVIKPTDPIELIKSSYLKSDQNHLPYQSYYQDAFMREAYYESNHLMKLSESGLRVYQTKRNADEKYKNFYKYNSSALIQSMRCTNDSITYEKVIDCVGHKWRNMLYSRFSATGYVKGINLLNMIYSYCLEEDKDKQIIYKGVVTYEEKEAHYIEILQSKKGKVYQISKLYLEQKSLAVMAFEVNATDGLEKINLLGFKERMMAWLFGVKFKVHKYYVRMQFKEVNNKYILDDVAYFLPIEFWRYNNRLIGYVTMQYKLRPVCKEVSFPVKSAVVEMNKKFLPQHTYNYEPSFWKGYPYFKITKDQLEFIKNTIIRNEQFKTLNR